MGTRKSKHNKGRKPFYKDYDRTKLADICPISNTASGNDIANVSCYSIISNYHGASTKPSMHDNWIISRPNPELSAIVKTYLAKKQEEQRRHDALQTFPDVRRDPERVLLRDYEPPIAERVETSRRDVLMEMFVERKITPGQMHAGRRWQADRERATLQPSRTIDWSLGRLAGYQVRGGLSPQQWNAMKRRRDFIKAEGLAAATMLDFLLDNDQGRSAIVRLMKIPPVRIEQMLDDLLTRLCEYFGRTRSTA